MQVQGALAIRTREQTEALPSHDRAHLGAKD
jgi:hypothetical protein